MDNIHQQLWVKEELSVPREGAQSGAEASHAVLPSPIAGSHCQMSLWLGLAYGSTPQSKHKKPQHQREPSAKK
ncbi:uncharacterized [Tachysurus ichikawai]